MNTATFTALLFVALGLVPAGAHLAELPNKIDLPKAEYQMLPGGLSWRARS